MKTHAQEFASDIGRRDIARAHWISRWPYYCSWCDGYGVSEREDGITEPCNCVLKGQCPRCGAAKAILIIHSPPPVVIGDCTKCGWAQTQGGLPG